MAKTNAHIDFSDLTADDRRGLGHTAVRQRLPKGTRLYKFTEHGVFGPRGISPWWAFVEPFNLDGIHRDPGLDGHIRAAHAAGIPVLAYARRVFAVMFEWNRLSAPAVGMARVQHITLTRPAIAFVAAGAPMPAFSSANANSSALDHARESRYDASLTSKEKRDTEAVWKQKAQSAIGTDWLEGGAIQVCLKNIDASYISAGAIQLLQ